MSRAYTDSSFMWPFPQKSTSKMLILRPLLKFIMHRKWQLKKAHSGPWPPSHASYTVYARENNDNSGRPLSWVNPSAIIFWLLMQLFIAVSLPVNCNVEIVVYSVCIRVCMMWCLIRPLLPTFQRKMVTWRNRLIFCFQIISCYFLMMQGIYCSTCRRCAVVNNIMR